MAQKGNWVSLAPFKEFVAVTDGDSYGPGTAHPEFPDAVFIGTTGNLVCVDLNGNAVTFTGVPAGEILPISPASITTAPAATLVLFR